MTERNSSLFDGSKIKKLKEEEQTEDTEKKLNEQLEILTKLVDNSFKHNEVLFKYSDDLMKENENLMKQNVKLLKEKENLILLTKTKFKSYKESYKKFEKMSTVLNLNEEQNLHLINSDLVDEKLSIVWDELKLLRHNYLGSGSDEKLQVHPFIEALLKIIITNFGDSTLNCHREVTLNDPTKGPDFVLSARNITRPSWTDCLGSIECKKYSKNKSIFVHGGGQSVEYCEHSFDLINVPNTFRFSAVTDGFSIQFFICADHSNSIKYRSQILELCPLNIEQLNSSQCSEGLKLLCQLIHKISEEALSIPTTVTINDDEIYNITTFIKRCVKTSNVCVINRNGVDCVVKFSEDRCGEDDFMRAELKYYEILKSSGVKMLKLDSDSNEDMLIFTEIGINLKSWCKSILAPVDDLKSKLKFLHLFRDILANIAKLHNFGYTHGDVRADNILVFEKGNANPDLEQKIVQMEAVLIDFACANRIDNLLYAVHGNPIFMSKKLIENKYSPFYYLTIYDLESFIYTFLDCISPDLFETVSSLFVPSRAAYGNKLLRARELVAFRNKFIVENLITLNDGIVDIDTESSIVQCFKFDIDYDLLHIFIKLFTELELFTYDNDTLDIYDKLSEILKM